MKKYYVYRHRTTTDNRVFYIGCGDEKRAYYTHKSLRSKEWLKIYENEGLVVEMLHITEDKEEALELEALLIQEYGRICDGGTLVNKSLFKRHGGVKHSEETKHKMSIANKGKKRSEEFRQKISIVKSKQVLQYTKDGKFIKEWSSIISATNELNIKHIGSVCNNKRKSAGGYIWKYKKEEKKNNI